MLHATGCLRWIGPILNSYCDFVFDVRHFLPISFMVQNCVHFDNWNKKIQNFPLKFAKKKFYSKKNKMYKFFHHKNWAKMPGTKNEAAVAFQNLSHPHQTPCINLIFYNFYI